MNWLSAGLAICLERVSRPRELSSELYASKSLSPPPQDSLRDHEGQTGRYVAEQGRSERANAFSPLECSTNPIAPEDHPETDAHHYGVVESCSEHTGMNQSLSPPASLSGLFEGVAV